MNSPRLSGAGLGLRRGLVNDLQSLADNDSRQPDFIEVTPENWMNLGGRFARDLNWFTQDRYPIVCHGLSLNLGGPDKLDTEFIDRLGEFFDKHHVIHFSEHLSYCGDSGHLYDLIPLPFTDAAVEHVAQRIQQVQQQLGRRIAVENVSAYTIPSSEMSEQAFLLKVIKAADCDLMLDVNNVYVNSFNHDYDPHEFIQAMPTERIVYMHVAGHLQETEDLIIDTHGDAVIDPVWDLLQFTYACHGNKPTLLERDFNLPPIDELLDEVATIRRYQQQAGQQSKQAIA